MKKTKEFAIFIAVAGFALAATATIAGDPETPVSHSSASPAGNAAANKRRT